MGFLGLKYRRPAKQPVGRSLRCQDSEESLYSQYSEADSTYSLSSIPDALTFDRIIEGGTCPPCTVRDFMNYLLYIEHSAENLQFFLWYSSYVQRFAQASTADLALAPEWTQDMQNDCFARLQKEHRDGLKRDPQNVAVVFKGTDFEKRGNTAAPSFPDKSSPIFSETASNPFSTPPHTPMSTDGGSSGLGIMSNSGSHHAQASDAFTAAGMKTPFTIQPFREEIDRVITTYISDSAPRQLNLSARERKQLLAALSHTTHPTAFRQAVLSTETALRMQSHPNFIRWSICNGNPARGAFGIFLGAFLLAASVLAYVLLCLSNTRRGVRAAPAAVALLGVATLVAACKGMCVVLHGRHHHHVRPWELFSDEEMELGTEAGSASTFGGGGGARSEKSGRSFESFGTANSYEDEPWVVKYEKRNLVRKVFDREVWIQEPALRSIQDTIFVQSLLLGTLAAVTLTTLFVCMPGGNLF